MAFPFVQLFISVGLSLLSSALRGRPKRPRPAAFDGPTAEQGKPIPIVFGQFALPPNVVWWGDAIRDDDDIPDYTAAMLMTVCHGPVTELTDLNFGGKSLRMAPTHAATAEGRDGTAFHTPSLQGGGGVVSNPDMPIVLTILGKRFFGGGPKEGGIEGEVRFYPGGLAQPIDPLTVHAWEGVAALAGLGLGSARPGIVYVPFGSVAAPFVWRDR